MKIEAGKYYKTRDGLKVGPMEVWRLGGWHADRSERPLNGGIWIGDGTAKLAGAKDSPTLISEWQDEEPSPIRTVKRREIVAGVYGKVFVNSYDKESNTVWINVKEDFGCVEFNATELREAAHVLNQIAEVLQDNGK